MKTERNRRDLEDVCSSLSMYLEMAQLAKRPAVTCTLKNEQIKLLIDAIEAVMK